MKCNIKNRLADKANSSGQVVKRLWELIALIALHREFGFGVTRLKRFVGALYDTYGEFTERASASDRYSPKHRELTNIDGAIICALRELRADGIDHRDILGTDEQLVIVDESGKQTDLDELLDKIEGRRCL